MKRNIDDYSEKYLHSDFECWQVRYRRKLISEQIEKYSPKRILEIGCGMEPLFLYFPDIEFTIIEPAKHFYNNAKELVQQKGYNNVKIINAFFGENEECSNLEREFDMIVCSGLLHEVDNPTEILSVISKKCNNNTIVHVNVPNAYSLHRLLAKTSGMIQSVYELSERNTLLQQQTVFDLKKLEKMITDCGFEVADKGSYFVKIFPHEAMNKLVELGIVTEQILDGFYDLTEYIPELGSEIYVNCRIKSL